MLIALFAVLTTYSSGSGARELGGVKLPAPLLALIGGSAYAAFPALLGAVVGVWLARKMGWQRPWVAGAALGVLFGAVWLAISAVELGKG